MDIYRVDKEGRSSKSGSLEGIRLQDHVLIRVDAQNPTPEELDSLQEFFNIHPWLWRSPGKRVPYPG